MNFYRRIGSSISWTVFRAAFIAILLIIVLEIVFIILHGVFSGELSGLFSVPGDWIGIFVNFLPQPVYYFLDCLFACISFSAILAPALSMPIAAFMRLKHLILHKLFIYQR